MDRLASSHARMVGRVGLQSKHMTRRTLSTAADVATGTVLLLLAFLVLLATPAQLGPLGPSAAGGALLFLLKLAIPVAGILLVARGVAGAPS
jgi:hypothetical protein